MYKVFLTEVITFNIYIYIYVPKAVSSNAELGAFREFNKDRKAQKSW